jgi:hypothetical protein
MREYKELLDLVSKMDTGTQKRAVSYVKMDVVSGEPIEVQPRSYPQLLEELASADTFAQMSGRQQRRQTQVSAQKQMQIQRQPEPQPLQSSNQQEQRSGPRWSMPSFSKGAQKPAEEQKWSIPAFPELEIPRSMPIPPSSQPQKPASRWSMPSFKMPQAQKQTASPEPRPFTAPTIAPQRQQEPALEQSAASELAKVVKSSDIVTPPPQQQAQVKQSNSLVLPNLSVTDQVTELDKIIQNIKNSSFNQDQIQIVREEVIGLSKAIASESKPEPSVGIERDMIDLRQVRLAEALALIRGI